MAKKQTQEEVQEAVVEVKKELNLDKMVDGAQTETIKFETASEGSLSPAERLERTRGIRAQLGKRFKAVVDYTDHGFSSGKHLESFVVVK